VTLVTQRTDGDCGVAALSTLLSDHRVRYEAICRAARQVHPGDPLKHGLQNRQLLDVARRFGLALTPTRAYNLDVDMGVLRLYAPHVWSGGHFVAVRDGFLWDPLESAAAPWREYRRKRRAKFGTLLRAN
jgi:ABC-type bacteriocin/lantibiotic exporter with double-glycine peptidase domain